MTHTRECPICSNEIQYTNKRSWYNAKKLNSSCRLCWSKKISKTANDKIKIGEHWGGKRDKEKEKNIDRPYTRKCPDCGKSIGYIRKHKLQEAIKNNTVCNSCSSYKYNKTWTNVISDEHIKQMRATKAGFDSWEEYKKKYPKKQFYKREVWRYTYQNDLEKLPNWEKRGRCGVDGAYQLDHIMSINEGWEKKIPPEQIAKWENLRMIPWKQNRYKGG
jgi:endogenous inhibitor of DNA gyrase (YacG/DUF329 family)